jgi:hypothetical protein
LRQLFAKFHERYNSKKNNPLISLFIEKSLKDFLNRDKLSTTELENLEKKLSSFSKLNTL